MATKWKKSKIAVSLLAFVVGVSLVIGSLASVAEILVISDRTGQGMNKDFQESWEFRRYISNQLASFLNVATGGKEWKQYEESVGDSWYYNNNGDWYWYDYESDEIWDGQVSEGAEGDASGTSGVSGKTASDEEKLAAYMAAKAENKNLRYAIVKGNKILYSNVDGLEGQTRRGWHDGDWEKMVPEGEFNFFLAFNRKNDGKVEITKDGQDVDIYGEGVFNEKSLWYVPGYTNFKVADSAGNVKVFMAVAKEPKVYVAADYAKEGSREYGRDYYAMYKDNLRLQENFKKSCLLLAIGAVLLVLAWMWREEKREGERAVGRFLQKIWLELKIFFGILLVMAMVCTVNWEFWREIQEMFYVMVYDGGVYWGDIGYYLEEMVMNGPFLIMAFWLVYLIVLDVRQNRGRQRKLFLGMSGTRGLKYTMQKNLVKRYRNMVIMSALALVLCGFALAVILMMAWEYGYGENPVLVALMVLLMIVLAVCVATGLGTVKKNRLFAEDVGALADQIAAVKEGNLAERLEIPDDRELKEAVEDLNEIQHGLEAALSERIKSERMKVDLITNVSHDIKTPLTSIISYVDLLKEEENLPSHVKDFIAILGEKSERLRTMVQDVFEVSKATSGQLPVSIKTLDLGKLLRQTLADMNDQIEESGMTIRTRVPEEPVMIQADGQRLYRVFQNLIQNALKYSMKDTRIFLTLKEEGGRATGLAAGGSPDVGSGPDAGGSPATGTCAGLAAGADIRTGRSLASGQTAAAGATAACATRVSGTCAGLAAGADIRTGRSLASDQTAAAGVTAACATRVSGTCVAAVYIKNTSAVELAEGVDFTERFVRGDVSRSDGGSGLGLSIARSFTEACGGSFQTEVDADLFTAVVRFPVVTPTDSGGEKSSESGNQGKNGI